MKHLFLISVFVFLSSFFTQAQDNFFGVFPAKNGKITFTDVVNVSTTSAKDLYNRAKEWATFSCDEIKWIEGTELVATKAIYLNLWCTIRIQVKDNRFKYDFTNFVWQNDSNYKEKSRPMEKTAILWAKKTILDEINNTIDGLKAAMQTPIDDNW